MTEIIEKKSDYYWEVNPKSGYFDLVAYFTISSSNPYRNGKYIRKAIMCGKYEDIEGVKQQLIDNTKCMSGGAWRPIEGGVWKWGGSCFCLETDKIEMLDKANCKEVCND